jgi:hypothetical protein
MVVESWNDFEALKIEKSEFSSRMIKELRENLSVDILKNKVRV